MTQQTVSRAAGGTAGAGLVRHAAGSWAMLCEQVAEVVQAQPAAPLEFDLVVTPGPAHRRSLSQYLAARPGGPQLSAGLEFVGWPGLLARLGGNDADFGDPWRGTTAALAVWDAISANRDNVALAPLVDHIGEPGARPGRPQAVSTRIARLFGRYADAAPDLVAGWLAGADLDPAGAPLAERDRWQPVLWRALAAELGTDPAQRRSELLAQLATGPVPGLGHRVLVVTLHDLPGPDQQLLAALAGHHQVHLLQLAGTPRQGDGAGSAFARRYGRRPALEVPVRVAADGSLLARIQDEIANDRAPAGGRPDNSLQVHVCHGPDRQVAVLRDVLTGLFTDDPELQPREVLVLCTDLAAYAPLISANFGLAADADDGFHPGHQLRVQLSNAVLGHANPVLQVLERLFELYAGRATSVDLVDLCSLAPVAHRFGFDANDLEQISRLVAGAEIRWGVDLQQRQRNGVPLPQSTWFAGVDRLLVSLALEPEPPVSLGPLTPIGAVSGGDARLVGALGELVSRVRRVLHEFGAAASPGRWAERLRAALELLVSVPPADSWQLTQVFGMLATFAEQAAGRSADWQAADVAGWLADRSQRLTGRPNYGNGSLLFTELGDLQAIEHKVICVLGLDDDRFPGSGYVDGDDLLTRPGARTRPHWTLERRTRRRQQLLDALCAATERFIVVCQGADEATGRLLPQPIAVADLLAAADLGAAGRWRQTPGNTVVHWHPLHPHGAADLGANEAGLPISFDRQSLLGALALEAAPAPAPPHHTLLHDRGRAASELDLAELIRFFTNPARGLLQTAAGTSLSRFDTELAADLPIDPDSLEQWTIGDALLKSLLAGHDPEQAHRTESLNWRLLGDAHGQRLLAAKLDAAQQIARAARAARQAAPRLVDCSIELDQLRLQGRVLLHGEHVVEHRFGWPKAKDALSCWLQLLAVAASGQHSAELRGIVVGTRCHQLIPPDPELARTMLGDWVRLRELGLQRVLPLPLEAAAGHVDLLSFERGEPMERARAAYQKAADENWRYFFSDFDELLSVRRCDGTADQPWFVALAAWTLGPIVNSLSRWWPDRDEEVRP